MLNMHNTVFIILHTEGIVMDKEQDKSVTHIGHDCHNYRHNIFVVSEHYKLEKCRICDRIVWFRWNYFWKRLTSLLFSHN